MITRRQFIKRASVLVGALIAGTGDLLRPGTFEPSLYSQTGRLSRHHLDDARRELEQRSLGNRPIFNDDAALFSDHARQVAKAAAQDQNREIAEILERTNCPMEFYIVDDCGGNAAPVEPTDTEIALSLYDDESVADHLDQFGASLAELRPELVETCAGASWPVEEEVSRIIVSNPEMSREDAFFQAVIERAESRL